jgi:hypothetical protein
LLHNRFISSDEDEASGDRTVSFLFHGESEHAYAFFGEGAARGVRPMSGNGNGNGDAPGATPGGVLPFRPRESAAPPRPARRRKPRAAEGAADGCAPADEPQAALADQVAALAARGLDEEEIRARLELAEALDGPTERVLAAAFRRGQLLGRAQIKEAQFEAALRGRVTAQTRVLARLGEPRGEDGGETDEGAQFVGDSPGQSGEPGES